MSPSTSAPAADGDQDMGLLTLLEVCPNLSCELNREEEDDLEEEMEETCALSMMMGDTRRAFSLRAKDYVKASVAEIYSPPRVTKAATMLPGLGIGAGAALDITTCDENGKPWDFSDLVMRGKADQLLDDTKPDLLVGSPMRIAFNHWQRLNRVKSEIQTSSGGCVRMA